MKQFIIRADDVGYSEAVNYGIAKTVKEGIIGSVGLMPNMPLAKQGLDMIAGYDVNIGQHTNICLGKPCADPSLVPSLLDENGNLKSSRMYRAAFAKGQEIVELDELVIEIEAQYKRFKELTGREPDYFEAHAVTSRYLMRALEIVAEKYDLRYSAMVPGDEVSTFAGKPISCAPMKSMEPDYDAEAALKEAVLNAREDMPTVYVCHPGYLDAFILNTSSLTVNRTKEVEMLTNPQIRQWLDAQQVELIRYSDV